MTNVDKRSWMLRPLLWLISLAGGYALAQWLLRDRSVRNIELVAHRGGALEAPESTAAAYRNAIAQGFTAMELDIQMTRDGEIVAFHDETLDRTTNGHGPLAEKTLAEIKELDAGSWFGAQWRGEKVLTFREVIDIAKTAPGRGARLLVEVKSPHLYPGIEQKMIEILEETGYIDNVVIMSFDGRALERVRALRPRLTLVQLYAHPSPWPRKPAAEAEVLGPMWQNLLINPSWTRLAHEGGRRVYVWTVNHAWAMRYLRAIRVDGIISDRPTLLRDTLRSKRS